MRYGGDECELSNNQHHGNSTGNWTLFGLPMAAMLCCGLPILIGALGFTAAGTFLTANRYWLLGGLVILMGVGMFVKARKSRRSSSDACLLPPAKNLQSEKN